MVDAGFGVHCCADTHRGVGAVRANHEMKAILQHDVTTNYETPIGSRAAALSRYIHHRHVRAMSKAMASSPPVPVMPSMGTVAAAGGKRTGHSGAG
jgi:hypothetical protein